MTANEFIGLIKTVVHDHGVRGVLESLHRPSGRRPQRRLVEVSQWFSSLADSDRERVKQVVEFAVHAGVFGMLTVVDGVVAIENAPDKGALELSYRRGDERHRLTGEGQEYLHDIYQDRVYEQVFGEKA